MKTTVYYSNSLEEETSVEVLSTDKERAYINTKFGVADIPVEWLEYGFSILEDEPCSGEDEFEYILIREFSPAIKVGEKVLKIETNEPIINELSLAQYNNIVTNKNKFDKFLQNVTKAYTDNEKAVYEVNGIEKYHIYFDGSTQTYMGNRWSKRIKHFKSAKDHHCTLNVTVGSSQLGVTVERLIKVAHDIETDSLPYELHNLSVNVMDLSGNEFIANKLGVTQDFSLDNLEWTLKGLNTEHPKTVLQVKKLAGSVYRIPANDLILPQIVTTHTEVVQEYLDIVGYKKIK